MTAREFGAEATVQIHLLGGFAVRVGTRAVAPEAWRLSKARSLIKLLALAPGLRLPRDQVLDALWPDFAPEAAQNNLHTTLAAVRRVLTPEATLQLRDGMLTLDAALPPLVDVVAFEAAALLAQRSGQRADYEAALARYGGELLPEDRYEDWLAPRRESLHATHQGLLYALAELQQRDGAETAALATLQRLVADDPLHEAAHMALMRLYATQGQQALAIRQYQSLRTALETHLDTEPSAAVRRLYADIVTNRLPARRAAPDQGAATPPPRAPHNLPLALSSFVGRQREIAELATLLTARERAPRLITLLGIGGMGKTRLVLAVAESLAARYADGAWFVDLAPLRDPALVVGAVANAVGVREHGGQPLLATLCAALAARTLLLVFDNCEHLLPAVREVVEGVLRGCPQVQVLATSRERLQVVGEVAWAVSPLAVPPSASDGETPIGTLEQAAAVRLFLNRVQERRPQFALTPENAPAVAAICRRLDGLPLALELAAARTAVLTVQQLADRLDHALGLLTTRERTLPERQQTLRATLDWSYILLPPDEQRLLARLAVFDGGCTLAAIEEVAADDDPLAILDGMNTLSDQSLIQRHDEPSGEARFRLLELVREYAHERLATSGDEATARQRHAEHYLALAERGASLAEVTWQRLLLAEEDNLRAALRWAVAERDARFGLRLVVALVPFWANRGAYREGSGWIDAILALADADADQPIPPLLRAHAYQGATVLSWQGGDPASAQRYGEQALMHYRVLGERQAAAETMRLLANVALIAGQHATVAALLDEAEGLLRDLGADRDLAMVLNTRGELVRSVYGDYARAEAHYREALALLRANGTAHWQATLLGNLAAVVLRHGGTNEALRFLRESLELRLALRHQRGIAICLELYAAVALVLGRFAQAARFYGAAEHLRRAINSPRTSDPADEAEYQHYLALARAGADPVAWEAAWTAGRTLALDQAITEALALAGESARAG